MNSVKKDFYREAFSHLSDEELLKRHAFALSATAEIEENLNNPVGLHESNRRELVRSRNKLHSEMGACGVLLTERGVAIASEESE